MPTEINKETFPYVVCAHCGGLVALSFGRAELLRIPPTFELVKCDAWLFVCENLAEVGWNFCEYAV